MAHSLGFAPIRR